VLSVAGRAWVSAVAVAIANLPVAAMDNHLTTVVFRDSLRVMNRLFLCIANGTCALISFALNRPPFRVRNYMLVSHRLYSFDSSSEAAQQRATCASRTPVRKTEDCSEVNVTNTGESMMLTCLCD
jgi:hypothetical protein